MYGVEVSHTLISNITDVVLDKVKTWRNRSLDSLYRILYLDVLHVKIKENGHIINKAIHLVLGINLEGHKEILDIWISENEGSKFWLKVLTDLKNQGLKNVFIARVDRLKVFPEAIETAFLKAQTQLCIVHMVRNSLKVVPFKL